MIKRLNQFWIKTKVRYKVALFIALLCSLWTLVFFIYKGVIFNPLVPIIFFSLILYCGFENSGILPETICDNLSLTILIVTMTIFLISFGIGIIIGFLYEKVLSLVPYLKNKMIRRNVIFVVVSFFI